MSTLAVWAAKQSGVANAGGGAKVQERKQVAAAMQRYLAQTPHAALFELYRGLGGELELPMISMENQHDGVRTGYEKQVLQQLTEDLVAALRAEDQARGLAKEARWLDYVLKKYGLERTKEDAHNRPKHKKDAEQLTRFMWDRYDATELLTVFARAEKAGENCHDMADAFLLALEGAVRRWILYCKEVLPRRKRGELRPDAAPLPDDPQRGTIRVLGIDPGTANMGVCLLELVGMQLPPLPPDADPAAAGASESEPLIRVLLLDLVDLKCEGAPVSKIHYAASSPRLLQPNYDHEDIAVLMKRALAAAEAQKEEKARKRAANKLLKEARAERKRQREEEMAALGPAAKKRKKGKEPETATMMIDLTEEQ